MTLSLSERSLNIASSLTVAIDTMAKQMIEDGLDVVSLGAGEPDFSTPFFICDQACKAINEQKTKYTAPSGILEVRKAVCEKLRVENNLFFDTNQIVMTSGAKHAVFNALAAIINPGDEVIIPSPYWVTYPELVKWLGGKPIFVKGKMENNFKITATQLKDSCTQKTKAILINNPCNPTGAVYSKQELYELSKAIIEADIYCISDEVYEYFVYEDSFTSIASIENMQNRTLVINGFSKSFCMTGWRIGYVAAPKEISQIIGKIQSQATHHPSNIAQYAALGALKMDKTEVHQMRNTFKKRRNYIVENISPLVKNNLLLPQGAFYLFAPVDAYYGKKTSKGIAINNSIDLCKYILEDYKLAIVPGAAFGEDSCVRFSYAASDEALKKACERFSTALNNLV